MRQETVPDTVPRPHKEGGLFSRNRRTVQAKVNYYLILCDFFLNLEPAHGAMDS